MRNHRKQPPPADKPIWEAHSTYTADLGASDRRRYRRTPPRSPTVADLVRPGDTVESDSKVTSYRDEEELGAELAKFQTERREFRAFWSLYGVDRNATTAIGDFVSKDTAHEVMNAILAIPAAARNALQGVRPEGNKSRNGMEQAARSAADWLDDMINQSSNDQRV